MLPIPTPIARPFLMPNTKYQRPVRTTEHNGEPVEYVEVTRDDIQVANRLATEVLGRTLDDLAPADPAAPRPDRRDG